MPSHARARDGHGRDRALERACEAQADATAGGRAAEGTLTLPHACQSDPGTAHHGLETARRAARVLSPAVGCRDASDAYTSTPSEAPRPRQEVCQKGALWLVKHGDGDCASCISKGCGAPRGGSTSASPSAQVAAQRTSQRSVAPWTAPGQALECVHRSLLLLRTGATPHGACGDRRSYLCGCIENLPSGRGCSVSALVY
jgi:hypothetical protein